MPSGGETSLYTAPVDVAVVLRDIVIVNATAAAAPQFALYLGPSARLQLFYLLYLAPLEPGTHHFELRQRLEATELLTVYNTTAGVSLAVTGYVLGP